jgi:hypothetical protein
MEKESEGGRLLSAGEVGIFNRSAFFIKEA